MKIDWTKTGVAFLLILLAAFTRLIPHPVNFTAIGALGIYAAIIIKNRTIAAIMPLVAMWISDLIINNVFYSSYYTSFVFFSDSAIWIYLGVLAHSLITWLFADAKMIASVSGASVLGALTFFLLSNFGVWIGTSMYSHTSGGVMACYAAALPFLGNFLAGNLFFSLVLIGIHTAFEKRTSFHLSA